MTDKPVYVRLLPSEQADLEASARRYGRSLSNMARLFIALGMRVTSECEATYPAAQQQTMFVEGD